MKWQTLFKPEESCRNFAALSIEERRTIITTVLKQIDIPFEIDSFVNWDLDEGVNILAGNATNFQNSQELTILSAHYDGTTVNDNASGVICLLYWALLVRNSGINSPLLFAFLDKEEVGQQGAKRLCKKVADYNVKRFINIEGMNHNGVAVISSAGRESLAEIFGLEEQLYLLTDGVIFASLGIESFDMFTLKKSSLIKNNAHHLEKIPLNHCKSMTEIFSFMFEIFLHGRFSNEILSCNDEI